MTDQETNNAIAETCGFQRWTHPRRDGATLTKPRNEEQRKYWTSCGESVDRNAPIKRERGIPNYCGDLNAMHYAESGLTVREKIDYQHHLSNISTKDPHVACWDLIHATARQRAEAFLKTIGKWRGE